MTKLQLITSRWQTLAGLSAIPAAALAGALSGSWGLTFIIVSAFFFSLACVPEGERMTRAQLALFGGMELFVGIEMLTGFAAFGAAAFACLIAGQSGFLWQRRNRRRAERQVR